MMNDEKIPLTRGNQMYDFIYVEDAVKAIYEAGRQGENFCGYYIGNIEKYPLKEFVLRMKSVVGSKSELSFGEVEMAGLPVDYGTKLWRAEYGRWRGESGYTCRRTWVLYLIIWKN